VATLLLAAFAAVVFVIRMGQVLIFGSVDWLNSSDPIAHLERVGNLMNFVVFPLAALIGGALVATARLQWRGTLIACATALGPLWLLRLSTGDNAAFNVVVCVGLFALALAPRMVTRVTRLAAPPDVQGDGARRA
jgi:hypothetical protein